MTLKRIIGYGVLVWLVPFAASVLLYGVRQADRALFESLISVVGIGVATAAALKFFARVERPGWIDALWVGLAWALVSIALDLPIFLGLFGFSLTDYGADVALGYVGMPVIAVGIVMARQAPS
jgi:hypothetical protein